MSKFLTATKHYLATLLASGFLLGPAASLAGESFARIIDTHPTTRPPIQSCVDLFSFGPFQVVDTLFREGHTSEQTRTITTERPSSIDPIVQRVLNDWVGSRDYTQDQALMLLQRDRSLDPRRTTYIHLENDGYPAMLRIFDGSTRVLSGGVEWEDASRSSAKTPLEIGSPGFEVPEARWARQTPSRPAYVWEISLLNIDRQLRAGVQSALGHVAALLDLHYNDNESRLLGETDVIANRKMMIYAQTRPNRVALFKKYGFQPVYTVGENGEAQPLEVARNSVLVYAKAEDFIKLHRANDTFVHKKSDPKIDNSEAYERYQENVRTHLEEIEARRVPIRDVQDVAQQLAITFNFYRFARQMTGKGADRRNVAIDFFESYLILINSIPESMRHHQWTQIRNLVRECMGQADPLTALYYFSKSMDRASARSLTVNNESFEEFFSDSYRVGAFGLLAPSQPTANMTFTPDR